MVETLKDDKGKTHIIFDKSELYDDSIMGNKLDDFEILQFLGSGAFGFVAKVRSKINKKIYAMKEMDFNKIKGEKEKELCLQEIAIHQKLDHPHIVKFYQNFKENNSIYIIMEFLDNTDMKSFLKVHKELNKPIKEETIWNILLQSISALAYLHNINVIHRDIKPGNIFMNNDKIIKLGDFGVSAVIQPIKNKFNFSSFNETIVGTPVYMSPEMINNNNYNFNTDVYSLGCTFLEMCFFEIPKIPIIKNDIMGNQFVQYQNRIITKNKDYYSKELINILNLMIVGNPSDRKSSKEIYEMVKKEYYKKFNNNSSISAVIRCMYSFEDLTYFLKEKTEDLTMNKYKARISRSFLFAINHINSQNFYDYINKFRQEIATENSKIENGNEIDPRFIIVFLLERMHKENNCKPQKNIETIKNKYIISSSYNGQDEDNTVEDEMLSKFLENFTSNCNSIISNLFFGMYKIKRICKSCNTLTYNFNSFCIASINLDEINSNNNKVSLKECIIKNLNYNKILTGINKVYCDNCLSYQDHEENRKLYMMPNLLIFSFGRGIKYKNKTMVDFPLVLNLENEQNISYIEHPYSVKNFQLVGIINIYEDEYNNNRYISINYERSTGEWYYCDYNDISEITDPIGAAEIGFPVLLFYQIAM